jgi:quinol monooxygenase YgiN
MVRVIIERHCCPGKEKDLESLLTEFRSVAMQQTGYISGETLKRLDDPLSWLVISTWVDIDHWNRWQVNPKRQEMARKIASLLLEPEKVLLYGFFRKSDV